VKLDTSAREQILREFRLNGFVVLRDVLPGELVAAMYEDLAPILATQHKALASGDSKAARGPQRVAFDIDPYCNLLKNTLGHDLYRKNPVVEEVLDDILGTWRRGWTQVECCWKGSQHMDWHSDQTTEETPDMERQTHTVRVTFNIPLVDFDWRTGPIELLPGSHMQARSFQSYSFVQLPRLYPVAPSLRRGDAILRDGNTLQRGTPNLSDHPRPMLDQTYKIRQPPDGCSIPEEHRPRSIRRCTGPGSATMGKWSLPRPAATPARHTSWTSTCLP
jgi:ectoine hydroxylase-related dioxygenase (phytanoyl-CoA dioxygenase family)